MFQSSRESIGIKAEGWKKAMGRHREGRKRAQRQKKASRFKIKKRTVLFYSLILSFPPNGTLGP
jgi:hypothetical protein